MKYERLTKETVGSFGYDLKDFEHKPKEFNDYDAFYAYKMAVKRLGELEDKIESGELDYVADSKTEQTITDLLIEFDEMGFAPTTVCENPEQYAIDWRERVRKEFTRLTAENDNLTVELDVAQRDVENLTRTLEEATDEIKALEAENAELRATLSKMETVEKELRERLEKAVELPTIYEHISYPYVERMYSETIYYVIYKENGRIMTEKFGKNKSKAEARLKEIKEKNSD